MAKDPSKPLLEREEWKLWEASYKEIPVSQLNFRKAGGERLDGQAFLDSIPDERDYRGLYQNDRDKLEFFSIFSQVEDSTSTSNKLKNLIRRIGQKEGCLTTLRWKVLELWLMGKSKRDITKILYPNRSKEIDIEGSGTVGVEVYVQRMLNHHIPMSLRYYVESHYPYVVWKYLKYYPLHPTFVKRAWVEACREPGDTVQNFTRLYSENPAAMFMLRKILHEESQSVIKVEAQHYLDPVQTHALAEHFLTRLAQVAQLNYKNIRKIFFDREKLLKCRSTMLYLLLSLKRGAN